MVLALWNRKEGLEMVKKVALVTGAAAGIGRAISLRLARMGIPVGALDLGRENAQKTAGEIRSLGGQAIALEGDIARRGTIQAEAARLRKEFGPITILVNNAALSASVPFLDMTDEQWDRMMEVNLKGTFIVTQTVLPDMIAAGWGRIVNLSSSSAQSGSKYMAHYSASKGGVIAFTKTIALEFGEHNITCNNIAPRFVMNTLMSEAAFRDSAHLSREPMIQAGPIKRQGEPEDIAGACAWLVSDEAGYVTGQTIGVNGGRYI
jgi:2-hydroxycyclohexanecarboxyl-CoA dehydrogenase